MTRNVFDNAMTAHVWAAQSQARGQSHNGNFWFEGRGLYSYGTHYCVGWALDSEAEAGGRLYLLNGDSSTPTTEGKHKNSAWRAVPRAYAETVPNLNGLVRVLEQIDTRGQSKAEAVRAVAAYLESYDGVNWPGADKATRILRAVGASKAEATRRGKAGQMRVASAIEKARAKAERAELDSLARDAKRLVKYDTPETAGREARDLLTKSTTESKYQAERLEAKAAELGREAHRCAKAAKAKGWVRVAAGCAAIHKAIRAEIRRFESGRARYAMRAGLASDIKAIRGAFEQMRQFWAMNPEARDGHPVADYGKAVRASETGAKGFAQYAGAVGRVCDSPFGRVGLTGPQMHNLRRLAVAASDIAETLRIRAGGLRTEWQAEARAAWRATGARPPHDVGQLCDVRGAALLRAEGAERDESGAIIGGTLRTSWGAVVPLPHAIRAFRFLKLCRDTATEWRANGRTLRVGHFRVDHIDSQGNFVAGCHRISWAECEAVAESLGVAELAADDTTESSHARGAA